MMLVHGLLNRGKLELMVDEVVQVHQSIILQNSRFFFFFFLKISQEIGKAYCKRLKRAKRASLTRPTGLLGERKKLALAPVSLFVFSLVPDLLFDCSRVLEYGKIRTVLQYIKLLGLSI